MGGDVKATITLALPNCPVTGETCADSRFDACAASGRPEASDSRDEGMRQVNEQRDPEQDQKHCKGQIDA
jgi:hypothetical protein